MAINSVNGNTVLETGMFPPCRVATTAAITLSGLQTVDGAALNAADRVLVWQQADATTNGIYAASSGTWVRTSDAQSNSQFYDGMCVAIAAGATWAGTIFQCTCTDDPVQVGTSQLTFANQSTVQTQLQTATSSTSQTVATGAKTFAITGGQALKAGQWVLIGETSNAANAMLAQISTNGGGALAVNVVAIAGSGTHADWTIVLNNSAAAAGWAPPVGTGNTTGPGSATAGHLATFADTTGKVLADSGIAPGTLAGRTTLQYGDAGTASISQAALAPGAAPLPYVGAQVNDNLHLSNDATNPTRDIDVSPGRVRDDSDVTNLQLVGTMVKRLDTAWAAGGVAGASAGGCDTGSKGASQTWHAYAIGKLGQTITQVSRTSNVATITVASHGGGAGGTARVVGIGSGFDAVGAITAVTTNTISYANTGPNVATTTVSGTLDLFDMLFSQSYPTPTLPSGWTVKQCLGSPITDGSGNLIAFTQIADEFLLATSVLDVNNVSPPNTSANLITLTVPKGLKIHALLFATMPVIGAGNQTGIVSSPDSNDVAPTVTGSTGNAGNNMGCATTVASGNSGIIAVRTDTSGRVRTRLSGTNAYSLMTLGWRDPRRRLF